ncbi:MAG: DUF547 domain-containing protein [Candidatus Omnitrophota bacterium]
MFINDLRNRGRYLVLVTIFVCFCNFNANATSLMPHDLFTKVLSKHVSEGRINFTDLCKDEGLNQYIEKLNTIDPQSMAQEKERFAFWLNVYNAYSLWAICKRYPIKSINDLNFGGLIVSVVLKKSVWDKPFVMVNHKPYTLRQVDHEILRPTFKDPRIQFAIACGAVGCAASRSEAYEANLIEEQLDDQARKFINNPKLNHFNKDARMAELSPLFNWSRKLFGKDEREVLLYISAYLPQDLRKDIIENTSSWKINYNKYDLTINDTVK